MRPSTYVIETHSAGNPPEVVWGPLQQTRREVRGVRNALSKAQPNKVFRERWVGP